MLSVVRSRLDILRCDVLGTVDLELWTFGDSSPIAFSEASGVASDYQYYKSMLATPVRENSVFNVRAVAMSNEGVAIIAGACVCGSIALWRHCSIAVPLSCCLA